MMVASWNTHVIIGTLGHSRDVNDLRTENFFNLANKQVDIPNSTHGAVVTADQSEQLRAIEGTAIGHLRRIVAEAHDDRMSKSRDNDPRIQDADSKMSLRNASSEKLLGNMEGYGNHYLNGL